MAATPSTLRAISAGSRLAVLTTATGVSGSSRVVGALRTRGVAAAEREQNYEDA